MSEIRLDPTPVTGGSGGRRALIVSAVAVALVGLAILKPWQGPSTPGPSPSPPAAVVAESSPDTSDRAVTAPTPDPRPAPTPDARSGVPFTTPPAPSTAADWSGIRWRRLDPADPVALVRDVVRFDGGYLALGPVLDADGSAGPAWASRDGSAWTPVPRGTWASLWPDQAVIAAAPVPGGVVALTSSAGAVACAATATCGPGASSVAAWISADGLAWAPQAGTGLQLADGTPPPHLAGGPAGLLAVDAGGSRSVALSVNGGTWRRVPDALPHGFVATGVTAVADGWAAAGWLRSDGRRIAATARSADGERWDAPVPLPMPTSGSAATGASSAGLVLAGADGTMLVGWVDETGAGWDGHQAWWVAGDAGGWTRFPEFCWTLFGCGSGSVVADGERMIALPSEPAGEVWASRDGVAWRVLRVSSDRPDVVASVALLPGGVVVRSGDDAWLGEALVPWPSR